MLRKKQCKERKRKGARKLVKISFFAEKVDDLKMARDEMVKVKNQI